MLDSFVGGFPCSFLSPPLIFSKGAFMRVKSCTGLENNADICDVQSIRKVEQSVLMEYKMHATFRALLVINMVIVFWPFNDYACHKTFPILLVLLLWLLPHIDAYMIILVWKAKCRHILKRIAN